MPDARLRVLLTSDTGGFQASIKEVNRAIQDTTKAVDALGEAAGEAGEEFQQGFGGIGSRIEDVEGAINILHGALTNLWNQVESNPLIQAAAQFETFRAQLQSLLHSTEAAKAELADLAEFAATTPFDLPGLVEADIQLRSFAQNAQRFLPIAATLAAVAGRDVPDAALALGKALSGIPEGLTQIQESFRITRNELKAAGAAYDNHGVILAKTVEQQERLADAIEKVATTKFPGQLEATSNTLKGAFSNLEDATIRLKASLGESLIPIALDLTKTLTGLIEKFNNLDPATKQTITTVAAAAAAFTGMATALGAVALALAPFGVNVAATLTAVRTIGSVVAPAAVVLNNLKNSALAIYAAFTLFATGAGGAITAASALAGGLAVLETAAAAAWAVISANPIGLLINGLILAGVAIAKLTDSRNKANKVAEQTLAIELKLADAYREQHSLLGLTVEQLKARGATDVDITKAIIGAEELANKERERANRLESEGNAVEAKRAREKAASLDAEADKLRDYRQEFLGTEAAKQQAVADTKAAELEAADAATRAYEKYAKDVQNHVFANKREQLSAADAVAKALENEIAVLEKREKILEGRKPGDQQAQQEFDAVSKRLKEMQERQALLEQERIDLNRDANEEITRNERAAIDQRVALGEIGKKEQARQLDELAAKQKAGSDAQIQLQQEAARLRKESDREAAASAVERLEAEKELAAVQEEATRAALERGEDIKQNEDKLTAAVKARTQAEIDILKAKAAIEKDANPEQKVAIEERTQAKIKQLREQEKKDLREVGDAAKAARAAQIEANNQLIASEQGLASARLAAAKASFEKTGQGGQQVLEELKAVQALNIERIEGEKKAALETAKTAQQRTNINQKANKDIAAARLSAELEVEDQIKAIAVRRASERVKDAELAQKELQNKKAIYEEEVKLGTAVGVRREREVQLALEAYTVEKNLLEAKKKEAVEQANISDKHKVARDYDLQILQAKRDIKSVLQQINAEYGKGNTELDKQIRKLERIRGRRDERQRRREEAEDKQERGEPLTPEEEEQLKKDREDEERDRRAERKAEAKRREEERKEEFRRRAQAQDALERARRQELAKEGKSRDEINAQIAKERKEGAFDPDRPQPQKPTPPPTAADESGLGKDKPPPKPKDEGKPPKDAPGKGPGPSGTPDSTVVALLTEISSKLTVTNTELAGQTGLYKSSMGGFDGGDKPHRTKGVN